MRLFFLFCFDFVIDFVLSECKNLKQKKKEIESFLWRKEEAKLHVTREWIPSETFL